MMLRVVVIWFGLLILAVLNGGFREAFLVLRFSRLAAQALSTVMLSLLILGFGWFALPWIAPRTLQDAWTIGVAWVVLTLAFEFFGGHFLFGKPWPELFADYNLFAGRIWVLVPIVTLLTPIVAFTGRGRDARRSSLPSPPVFLQCFPRGPHFVRGHSVAILALRMRIRELDRVECGDVLSRNDLARLACARHGQPYIVPIHYSFDAARNCLYAFSTVGQKIDWMRENPLVCVEVEEIADKRHWTTVLIFGRYEEMTDSPEDASARRTAQTLFEGRPQWWLPAAAKVGSHEHPEMVLYRIIIDRMSGRRTSRRD